MTKTTTRTAPRWMMAAYALAMCFGLMAVMALADLDGSRSAAAAATRCAPGEAMAEDGSCVGAGFYSGNSAGFEDWKRGVYAGEYTAHEYTWTEYQADHAADTTAAGVAPEGAGLGYGPAYWRAVELFVSVDNDTYAGIYHAAGPRRQNVMYRAAYDSITGTLYEDFSYSGDLVSYGEPVHVHTGPAPAFG